jgi:hypothetical protein
MAKIDGFRDVSHETLSKKDIKNPHHQMGVTHH